MPEAPFLRGEHLTHHRFLGLVAGVLEPGGEVGSALGGVCPCHVSVNVAKGKIRCPVQHVEMALLRDFRVGCHVC